MIEVEIRKKIENLIARARAFELIPGGTARDTRELSLCEAWLTEALNVVEVAVPRTTNAYRRRIETLAKASHGAAQAVLSIARILDALLVDLQAGLLGDLGNSITAEAFDDFLDHAEAYLHGGRKMEAGVIAGVVFEDTIRRIYRNQDADDKGQKLEDLINFLARQNVITGQQSKQAKVASHVRTKATHAQWEEFDSQGVADTIQITRLFLRDHLGG